MGFTAKTGWAAALLVAAWLAGASGVARAAPVYLDIDSNLEWRQVIDTVGFSYNQMNKDTNGQTWGCSASSGVCSGDLGGGGGAALDGWTWATELQVRTLFHNFSGVLNIPGFDPLPAVPTSYQEALGSTWLPALLDVDGPGVDQGVFDATLSIAQFAFVSGFSRTLASATAARAPDLARLNNDAADTAALAGKSASDPTIGFWLVRPAEAVVPAPTTLCLLATGLAALGWRRRK